MQLLVQVVPNMKKILVCGLAVVDFLFEVPEMPRRAEKYIAHNAEAVGGGGAANAAVAIARLNARALLAARVGDDMFGQMIMTDLLAEHVDCSLVQKSSTGSSSFSSVLIDKDGERQIVNFRGRDLSDETAIFEQAKVDGVLTDTRWKAGAVAAMSLAKRLNVPGVVDAEAPVDPLALMLATHVAFSAQGLLQYCPEDNLSAALLKAASMLDAWVCVTDGANGVYYVEDSKVLNVPAPTIDVVDTLGAGDVWHGAFVVALVQQQSELQAIKFANAAASLKCTRQGGGRNGPTLDEVATFMIQVKE